MALPEGDAREYLLDGLANLIRCRGYEPFVLAPILLPETRFFPDKWQPDPRGIRTLLRRLMRYAGLEQVGVMLHVYTRPSQTVGETTNLITRGGAPLHAAAWYAGVEDGCAHFGCDLGQLRHKETLVGALGHEVAHLYRDHHGLVVVTRRTEELLTDLTAVYLGFGLFVFEASYSFRTGGYSANGQPLLFETQQTGYLPLGAIALLLGAQLACRGLPERDVKRLSRQLSANQAALLMQAYRALADDPDGLRARLGLDPPDAWPPAPDLEPLTALLDEEDDEEWIRAGHEHGIAEPDDAEEDDPLEAPDRPGRLAPEPAPIGWMPSIVFGSTGLACGAYFGTTAGAALGAAGALVGLWLARSGRGYRCAHCKASLHTGVDWCPECEAPIEW